MGPSAPYVVSAEERQFEHLELLLVPKLYAYFG